jgi:hypothetical protein
MDEPDPMMEQIHAANALHHRGDREDARARFAELWDAIGPAGDALHRVTLAHFMADVQDAPEQELIWDLRALDAADGLTDGRLKSHHDSLSLAAFYPSLHLNVAEGYRRLGDLARARAHIALAIEKAAFLPEYGLGGYTRRAIARLAGELADAAATE